MDSVSQFVLGAAVGGVVLGHRAGAKALLWGGVIATIPDLDVLVPLGDPVSNFTYHRSASHSLFVLTLITPLLTWLILRLHPAEQADRRRWSWLVWLVLVTHVLLDCLTIYGTQIFWPFWSYPVGAGSLFIIDPLYTLPLLIAVIGGLWLRREPARLRRWSLVGLVISSGYAGYSLVVKAHVDQVVAEALQRQNVRYSQFMTVPTYFNTLLWRTVVMTDTGYLEGFYSWLDPKPDIRFREHRSQPELLEPIANAWPVQRLQWFTKGFYRVSQSGGRITLTDLRMGQEPYYVFSFVVGQERAGRVQAVSGERAGLPRPEPTVLNETWSRIMTGPDYELR